MISEDEELGLARRAYAAYFKAGNNVQPSQRLSGVKKAGSLKYVVLRDSENVLAVYRVRNDGVLKGLKRWPAELLT
ncbi:hypothetical protein [Rhizobacter fulvus]